MRRTTLWCSRQVVSSTVCQRAVRSSHFGVSLRGPTSIKKILFKDISTILETRIQTCFEEGGITIEAKDVGAILSARAPAELTFVDSN